MVCPLEAIQAGERTATTALILSESQFVALCEAAGSRRCEFGELVSASAMFWSIRFPGTAQAVSALGRVVGGKDICLADVEQREVRTMLSTGRGRCAGRLRAFGFRG